LQYCYESGTRTLEKCFKNALWNVGSAFQNIRLGSINLLQRKPLISLMHHYWPVCHRKQSKEACEFDRHIIMLSSSLCSPNKDFGRRKKHDSRPWNVLRKSASYLLFILPTSSFGEHNFRLTFRWFVAQISNHALEKCFLRNPHFIFCSSFQNHLLEGVILRVRQTHYHAIIILWVWQTHRGMLSSSCDSSCEFDRHIGACYLHLVNLTYTSSCYHHLVSSTDTSGHAIIILWVWQTHRGHVANKKLRNFAPTT
jgi:hypothetical protein